VNSEMLAIRNCTTLEDFNACLDLQREVWGFSDLELVPLRVFSLAAKIGGQVIGAWDGDTIAGFALSIPGTHRRYPYLHSHMLGVKEPYRNTGLGRRIKLFQREDAIAHGYELIEWTFDPLEIKNAYFNMEKLGAVARQYVVNLYGIVSSPLQGGLPTDRLVAEWWLRSPRVERTLLDGHPRHPEIAERVEVPAEVYLWKSEAETRAQAAEILRRTRDELQRCFAAGLTVVGYERTPSGDGRYLLGAWNEAGLESEG
jgi:predicted GNAT superfamily acetyltransferase